MSTTTPQDEEVRTDPNDSTLNPKTPRYPDMNVPSFTHVTVSPEASQHGDTTSSVHPTVSEIDRLQRQIEQLKLDALYEDQHIHGTQHQKPQPPLRNPRLHTNQGAQASESVQHTNLDASVEDTSEDPHTPSRDSPLLRPNPTLTPAYCDTLLNIILPYPARFTREEAEGL